MASYNVINNLNGTGIIHQIGTQLNGLNNQMPIEVGLPDMVLSVSSVGNIQWSSTSLLVGPTGSQGIQGPTGSQGIQGSTGAGGVTLLSLTELTATTLVTHTVAVSLTATAINLNSDGTNRFAKVVFTAPPSGKVSIKMEFDAILTNSATNLRIGLHGSSASTTTPTNGWFRVNGDDDASSNGYSAEFIINGLTSGISYTRYFVACSDFSTTLIRASSAQTGIFAVSDLPQPLRIKVEDLGSITISTNPSS